MVANFGVSKVPSPLDLEVIMEPRCCVLVCVSPPTKYTEIETLYGIPGPVDG